MSDLVQEFAKTTTFKYFYSTLMRFDADLNCFVATEKWRDKEAELLTAAWWMFQEQHSKVDEHRKRRYQLTKQLTQKSLRLTDAEFEYKRIKLERAKDVLTIMRLTARNEKLQEELKALRGEHV